MRVLFFLPTKKLTSKRLGWKKNAEEKTGKIYLFEKDKTSKIEGKTIKNELIMN